MTWTYNGFARIHFNRKEEAPLLASITNRTHDWEVLAKSVSIRGVSLLSDHDLEHARPGQDPVWWLEGYMHVEITDEGYAILTPFVTKPVQEAPQGIMSGAAIDVLRERENQSAGFATALGLFHGDTHVLPEKKRRTRKKSAKRRVR